jgi:hypothetical protein
LTTKIIAVAENKTGRWDYEITNIVVYYRTEIGKRKKGRGKRGQIYLNVR